MRIKKTRGFTLIELLIVVAIIAILAAIAIPNFLAAQTRAKVSRAKANMRTATTALESYFVDNNTYPGTIAASGQGVLTLGIPVAVTTPIAYVTTVPKDDFDVFGGFGGYSLPIKLKVAGWTFNAAGNGFGTDLPFYVNQADGLVGTDQAYATREANSSNVQYALFSVGPGHALTPGGGWYTITGEPTGASSGHFPQPTRYWYDPTNGTISLGYVVRLSGGNVSN
jgi:type II secretion system protein G